MYPEKEKTDSFVATLKNYGILYYTMLYKKTVYALFLFVVVETM